MVLHGRSGHAPPVEPHPERLGRYRLARELVACARIATLREAGREAQLVEATLAYGAGQAGGDDTPVAVALLLHTWQIRAAVGR